MERPKHFNRPIAEAEVLIKENSSIRCFKIDHKADAEVLVKKEERINGSKCKSKIEGF